MLGICIDVTEHKLAKEALREREEKFRVVFEQSPIAIELYNAEDELIDANSECLRLFGVYSLEMVKGFKLFEDPNIPSDIKNKLNNRIPVKNETVFDFELVKRLGLYKTSKTGTCYIDVLITPLGAETGIPGGYLVHVQDITERKIVEQALSDNVRFMDTLINTIPNPIFYKNAEGIYLGCNDAFAEQFLGLSRQEIIGKSLYDFPKSIPKDLADFYHEQDIKLIYKTGTQFYETQVQSAEGVMRNYLANKATFTNASGAISGIVGVLVDLTEYRRVENALRKSEKEKALILNSTSEMFIYHDTELKMKWVNKAAGDSVGLQPEDLVGQHCYEIWQQRDTPCEGCPVLKALKTRKPQESEMVTPDGRSWSLRGYPVFDDSGEITGLIELTQNITERKKAEEALRESEERYRTLVETSQDLLFRCDSGGRLTYLNKSWEHTHGFKIREMLGKKFTDFLDPELGEKKRKEFEKEFEYGSIRGYETVHISRDGKKVHLRVNAIMLHDKDGKVIGIQGTAYDMTEQKRLQEQLQLR